MNQEYQNKKYVVLFFTSDFDRNSWPNILSSDKNLAQFCHLLTQFCQLVVMEYLGQ